MPQGGQPRFLYHVFRLIGIRHEPAGQHADEIFMGQQRFRTVFQRLILKSENLTVVHMPPG
jgi:hypothetical protein